MCSVSTRSILFALPALYLLVAIYFVGNRGVGRLPALSLVPSKNLVNLQGFGQNLRSGNSANEIAEAPVVESSSSKGVTNSKASVPEAPPGKPYTVKYFTGEEVTVYPHDQDGGDW